MLYCSASYRDNYTTKYNIFAMQAYNVHECVEIGFQVLSAVSIQHTLVSYYGSFNKVLIHPNGALSSSL